MTTTGFLPCGLERMQEVLSGYVERRELTGLVALVSRGEEVQVQTFGTLSIGDPAPMLRNSLFRIASLTKLVTAVAAMILVEECRIRLDDPIDPWLPELANRRVLKSISSPIEETVAARRPITVRDLFTFRMGFGSVMAPRGTYPIQKLMREYRIGGDTPPKPALLPATEEWLERLGSLPLMAQPGEKWLYHVSSDVLGVLIARVSGQSLGSFMRERIFEPLGMNDTSFAVPHEEMQRLPSCYSFNRKSNRLELFDSVENSTWLGEPPFESGGGGLVSTVDDFHAFLRMLIDKGAGASRILSPASVELMTSDHLTEEQRTAAEIFFGGYRSWGFGMAVDIRRDQIFRSPGRFGWDGGLGTSAYADPEKGMIGILFTQRMMESPQAPPLFTDFWTLAYAAMR